MNYVVVYLTFALFALLCLYAILGNPLRGRSVISRSLFGASLILIVLSLFGSTLFYEAETYFGDLWTALEAMNKSASGLRSSVDFYSPIGPVYDWFFTGALFFKPISASTLLLANGMFAALAFLLGWLMLRTRSSALGMSLCLFIVVTAAASPREIDSLFADLQQNYLAPYNRWAWAILIPIALRLAIPNSKKDTIGSIALGVGISLLLLLKVTYGVAALGLLVVSLVFTIEKCREALIALISICFCLVVVHLFTGQLLPYLQDLSLAAAIQESVLRFYKLLFTFGEMAYMVMIGVFLLLICTPHKLDSLRSCFALVRPIGMIMAVAGAAWIVLMQNHYNSGASLYFILPLIIAEWSGLFREEDENGNNTWWQLDSRKGMALVVLTCLIILRPSLLDAGSMILQPVRSLQFDFDPKLEQTQINNLIIHPKHRPDEKGKCYSGTCIDYTRMSSGLDMLITAGANARGAKTVLALNFSNPFPILLGKESPKASPIWFHNQRSFSTNEHINPKILFKGVGFVLLAKNEPNADALKSIYSDHLGKYYKLHAENKYWFLFTHLDAEL